MENSIDTISYEKYSFALICHHRLNHFPYEKEYFSQLR